MSNLSDTLRGLFGAQSKTEVERKKIEAESKRLTEQYRKREIERKEREIELRHAASEDFNCSRVEQLIKQGIDVNAQDPETGRTALIIAVDYGCRTILTFLLTHQADIHIKAKNGKSAVDFARAKGQMDVVRLLEDIHRTNQVYGD